MAQEIETTNKSAAADGLESPDSPHPGARPAIRAAEQAFHARIVAARARVDALLALQDRPPLEDWPLPDPSDETRESGETSALEFLERAAGFGTDCAEGPGDLGGLQAAGIRAGLNMLADARGQPRPDFSEEYRAFGRADPATGKVPPAPEPHLDEEEGETREWEARVRAIADDHGGLVPLSDQETPQGGWTHARLPEPCGPPARPVRAPDEAEAELVGIMADCRVMLRDVAMQSARLCVGADDRIRFIEAACRVARTTAGLGKTVARMRAASTGAVDERRQRIIVERLERRPSIRRGEGGR